MTPETTAHGGGGEGMYPNLVAEMARINIGAIELARVTGRTERTIRNKISGRQDFSLYEILAIRNNLFPKFSLEYLFAKDGSENAS